MPGGDASTRLPLYGERYGLWLLHRRITQRGRRPSRGAAAAASVTSEVLVADSADALMVAAGLGDVEKRLFQSAGLLRPETPWAVEDDADDGDHPAGQGAASEATLDLSGLPERQRRHLRGIANLAQKSRLNPSDTDLLLKTARHLSK